MGPLGGGAGTGKVLGWSASFILGRVCTNASSLHPLCFPPFPSYEGPFTHNTTATAATHGRLGLPRPKRPAPTLSWGGYTTSSWAYGRAEDALPLAGAGDFFVMIVDADHCCKLGLAGAAQVCKFLVAEATAA